MHHQDFYIWLGTRACFQLCHSCTEHISYESAPDVFINDMCTTSVHVMHVAQGTNLAARSLKDLEYVLRPPCTQNTSLLRFTAIQS